MSEKPVEDKRCPYCKRMFAPNYRHGNEQKTCGAQDCQRERRNDANKQRRKKDLNYNRHFYIDYIKPRRERMKARKAASLKSSSAGLEQSNFRHNAHILPLVLVKQTQGQIIAYINESFSQLKKKLSRSSLISNACRVISNG